MDDNRTLAAIRNNGGRVNQSVLAWQLGASESEVFGSLDRLVHDGRLVEAQDRSGMITA